MFEVVLKSVDSSRAEHVGRVVHKHNRALDHSEFEAVVERVARGGSEVVARCHERRVAENVVAEFAYHRALAEVREID